MRKINIVDKENNLIGTKPKDQIDYLNDIYQSSALWITNSKEEALLAQRKLTKPKDPGLWGPAVEGTVDEGETHESNIYKEAKEEVGLEGFNFDTGPLQYQNEPRRQFIQWYLVKLDFPIDYFVPQESEVEKLEWIDKEKLILDLKNNPDKYVPSLTKIIDKLDLLS